MPLKRHISASVAKHDLNHVCAVGFLPIPAIDDQAGSSPVHGAGKEAVSENDQHQNANAEDEWVSVRHKLSPPEHDRACRGTPGRAR